jgi:hypothetical protein
VLDYVRLRRERGATANAIVRNLLTHRNKVIVAPSGNYGCIVDVISKKAGSQQVSDTDSRNLVEFWKQIYGIIHPLTYKAKNLNSVIFTRQKLNEDWRNRHSNA